MGNKLKIKKWCIGVIIFFICYHVISFVVTFCSGLPYPTFWLDNIEYTYGKNLRIYVDKRSPNRVALGDSAIEGGRLDYNVYAYEGYDGFFFTYKDDVFYSYGSTGFFVIYADPFKIKLIRNKNLSKERSETVDRTLSRYPKDELILLTSSEQLTKNEKTAYKRLQIKAKKQIEKLKKVNEYP